MSRRHGACVVMLLLASTIGAFSPPALADTIIYVDDDAPLGGDGRSWETAYRYLQDALVSRSGAAGALPHLDAAGAVLQDKVEIRVAQGVYKPDRSSEHPEGTGDRYASFELISGVSLVGGYAGFGVLDPNLRDFGLYATILSGDLAGDDNSVSDPCDLDDEVSRLENSCNIIEIRNVSGTRLDGLIISAGYGNIGQREKVASTIVGAGALIIGCEELILKDCTFVNNYAGHGASGCMIGDCANVILDNCDIVENSKGGISLSRSTATILDCTIGGNHLWGANLRLGSFFVEDCVFRNNAGIGVLLGPGSASFKRCTIEGHTNENRGGRRGAGVETESGTHRFADCHFYNNTTATYGGALYLGFSSTIYLGNCVFAGNSSQRGGAVAGVLFKNLDVQNCTFVDNRAMCGSSLLFESTRHKNTGGASIVGSVLASGHDAITTDDVALTIDYSLLLGGHDAVIDPNNNVTWGTGNLNLAPGFANPGYWDSYGTADDPNDDFFVVGDYHLKSQAGRWDSPSETWVKDDVTSPCIDAGDPNNAIMYESFPNGGRINLGAYGGTIEASKSYFGEPACETIIAGDINGDCRVDSIDLKILMDHWLEGAEEVVGYQ